MENFWVGTFPDWLVGIGTIGLTVVTLVALRLERAEKRQLQAQVVAQNERETRRFLEEAERAIEHEHRAQAELIVVWSEMLAHDDLNYVDSIPNLDISEAAIVQNDSSLPITNVWVQWYDVRGPARLESRLIQTVPPRSRRSIQRPWSLIQNPTMPVELVFTDAKGVVWDRSRDGRLREIEDAPAVAEPAGE
jgi:hypothetical protein